MTGTSRCRCCGTGRPVASSATTSPTSRIDLETQFGAWANPAYDLYPEHLRPQIDELNDLVYATVNNGVYRSGFATTQESYHEAVSAGCSRRWICSRLGCPSIGTCSATRSPRQTCGCG